MQVDKDRFVTVDAALPSASNPADPSKDGNDPDARAAAEHARLFLALWLAMQEGDLLALCAWTASAAAAPRLAALCMQVSQLDADGKQARASLSSSPALALRSLPYQCSVVWGCMRSSVAQRRQALQVQPPGCSQRLVPKIQRSVQTSNVLKMCPQVQAPGPDPYTDEV
jgi:hypothetical protein